MHVLKKTDDILPLMLGFFGIFIIYSFPLFTPKKLMLLDTYNTLKFIFLDKNMVKNYADIFNRFVITGIILYILLLYRSYFQSITLITTIILMVINVFYMALLANVVPIPHIDFFPIFLIGLILWHCCFLGEQNILSLLTATILFVIIAFFNPVASVCLAVGLLFTEKMIAFCNKNHESCFYNIIFILLSGFCSFTISLLKSKNINYFIDLLRTNYHFPVLITSILVFLIVCYHISKKDFVQEIENHRKGLIFSYGIVTFIGAVFIGRFDYIANFV